jgi:hypothetical protein
MCFFDVQAMGRTLLRRSDRRVPRRAVLWLLSVLCCGFWRASFLFFSALSLSLKAEQQRKNSRQSALQSPRGLAHNDQKAITLYTSWC